jgi:uncharacterized repeat protein (TIGR01451 family)
MDNVGAYSFYKIVYTAAQARATIAAGRMAVILAVESSDIFNGNDPISTLVGLYNNGVRTLQPLHQFNGKLGGVSFHDEVIVAMQTIKNIGHGDFNHLCKSYAGNGSYAHCNAKIGNINYKGLTAAGKSFIIKMMQLGMPIDIAHMSEKSIADVQTLTTGTCNYPAFISHGHVRDLLERGSDFPSGTEYGWKAKNSHEKTVPGWIISYVSNSGGLFGLRTGPDYYDFLSYQGFLTLAGLGNAPIPSKGSLQMNKKSDKLGGTEYHFAYAVDYLTRVKNVNVALGSDFNGLIEQMLFDNEGLTNCPGTSATDTQDCKMAGMAHIGKEYALMNQKLNATGLQNVSSYNSLRNNSADAYVQMWERSTSIAAGNCCNPITVSQLETTGAYNGATAWITIDGTGFNALTTMSAKLRVYQGTTEYACTGFQMISSTQAACLAPAGLPVGFYDVIVSNKSGYCNQSGVRTKAIFMTDIYQENVQRITEESFAIPVVVKPVDVTPVDVTPVEITPGLGTGAKLCVTKFHDLDGDGVQDLGEPGLPGWTFTVSGGVGTITTGPQGSFCSVVPAPGTYTASEQGQPGWTPTTPNPQQATVSPGQSVTLSFGNKKADDKKCDLTIQKTVDPNPPIPGQQAAFVVRVRNVGSGLCAPTTSVTDTLPSGITVGGLTPNAADGWACFGTTAITCTNPTLTLQPNQTSTVVSILGKVTAPPGTSVKNCAGVKHPQDTNPTNNEACIAVTVPVAPPAGTCDVEIRKTGDPPQPSSGQQVFFNIALKNVGTGPCGLNTVVQDPRPQGLTFTAAPVANQSGWACSLSGGNASCVTAGTLPPGYTARFTFPATVTAPPGSTSINCATVSNPADTNPANNQSCVTIQVQRGVGPPPRPFDPKGLPVPPPPRPFDPKGLEGR